MLPAGALGSSSGKTIMETPEDHAVLAKRFIDAVEAGDIETVGSIYAAEAEIWHNNGQRTESRDQNLATMRKFIGFAPTRHYTKRKITPFPDGFLHQHVIIADATSGERIELAACIVCKVVDGKITRLEEYIDSAPIASWRR
jgi:ketosteroid isomerase-like protein